MLDSSTMSFLFLLHQYKKGKVRRAAQCTRQAILMIKLEPFYVCTRTKSGQDVCKFDICDHCHNKVSCNNISNHPRKAKGPKSQQVKKNKGCCHALQDLELETDPWWSDPGCMSEVNCH